jgi:multidrug resistance protein MdtO
MLYMVFMYSGAESVASLVSAVVSVIGVTLAVVLTLLLLSFDASEPALRLPLMAASTFLGMFLMRILALGPLAFAVGLILVFTQTLVDTMPSVEALTRIVLWFSIVIALPAALTALVNLIAGEDPAKLARRSKLRLLDAATAILQGGHSGDLFRSQAEALGLLGLQQHAEILDRSLHAQADQPSTDRNRRRTADAPAGAACGNARTKSAACLPPRAQSAVARWRPTRRPTQALRRAAGPAWAA